MSMYYEGYREAQAGIREMNESELWNQIEALYGRDDLPEDPTLEELRLEALDQCRRDFTNIHSKEYEMVQFWVGVIQADKNA